MTNGKAGQPLSATLHVVYRNTHTYAHVFTLTVAKKKFVHTIKKEKLQINPNSYINVYIKCTYKL